MLVVALLSRDVQNGKFSNNPEAAALQRLLLFNDEWFVPVLDGNVFSVVENTVFVYSSDAYRKFPVLHGVSFDRIDKRSFEKQVRRLKCKSVVFVAHGESVRLDVSDEDHADLFDFAHGFSAQHCLQVLSQKVSDDAAFYKMMHDAVLHPKARWYAAYHVDPVNPSTAKLVLGANGVTPLFCSVDQATRFGSVAKDRVWAVRELSRNDLISQVQSGTVFGLIPYYPTKYSFRLDQEVMQNAKTYSNDALANSQERRTYTALTLAHAAPDSREVDIVTPRPEDTQRYSSLTAEEKTFVWSLACLGAKSLREALGRRGNLASVISLLNQEIHAGKVALDNPEAMALYRMMLFQDWLYAYHDKTHQLMTFETQSGSKSLALFASAKCSSLLLQTQLNKNETQQTRSLFKDDFDRMLQSFPVGIGHEIDCMTFVADDHTSCTRQMSDFNVSLIRRAISAQRCLEALSDGNLFNALMHPRSLWYELHDINPGDNSGKMLKLSSESYPLVSSIDQASRLSRFLSPGHVLGVSEISSDEVLWNVKSGTQYHLIPYIAANGEAKTVHLNAKVWEREIFNKV